MLHVFVKKTQKTAQADIEMAQKRYRELQEKRKDEGDKNSNNVFLDCGFGPVEAENLRIRTDILIALTSHIGDHNLTRAKAAKLLNVAPAKVAELLNHRIDSFTIDELIGMLTTLGLRVDLSVRPAKTPRKVA